VSSADYVAVVGLVSVGDHSLSTKYLEKYVTSLPRNAIPWGGIARLWCPSVRDVDVRWPHKLGYLEFYYSSN